MKRFEFLGSRIFRLAAFSLFCFLAPYLAPLIQRGDSTIYGTLWAKVLFAFAATAAAVLCAVLIRKKAVRVAVTAAVWAVLELLILFEAFMFCFTGHSFDQSFLLHFNINAVPAEVIRVFWKPVGAVLLVFFAATAAAGYLAGKVERVKSDLRKRAVLILALVLFFLPETPGVILTGVIAENAGAAGSNLPMEELGKIRAEPGKNLVFIVVESLEKNYLSEKHFPGLIPNISKWMNSKDALVFENMVGGASNTFDFLYQAHMGDYMYSITDGDHADRQMALSLVLRAAGYKTAFLKACTLEFANTGTFLEKVKYEKRMDCRTPEVKAQVTEPGAWGFRDYELFEIAKGEFNKLAAQKKPFAFTVLTVDSHAPVGVIGKRSLSYVPPDGEKRPLLSALHTTDTALGDFLEFIKNSPVAKDTVVVVSGDHLVMRPVVPDSHSVQSILEYKKRENLITFILNGKDHGKVTTPCWPVDLPLMILHEMGVTHNAVFPHGVNALVEKNAAPRKKLTYNEYAERKKKRAGKGGGKSSGILSTPVRFTAEDESKMTLHIGDLEVKCTPQQEGIGAFIQFQAAAGLATPWREYLDRRFTILFGTHQSDRSLFFILYANKNSMFHFILGEEGYEKRFLAAVVGGWYKIDHAKRWSGLKLSKLDEPLPGLAEAKVDVSKNIVTLKKGDWTFPLFSKTDTYLAQCAIFATVDAEKKENIIRASFLNRSKMNGIYDLLTSGGDMVLIAPPDSPLHRQFGVPEKQRDQLMRVRITPQGETLELFPLRLPHESYIEKTGSGQYVLRREGEKLAVCRLIGGAPAADFGDGMCYAATFDKAGDRVVAARSFRESRVAVELMQSAPGGGTTLLICGKNSEFLKKYYPQLSKHNVLFAITPSAIRHAVQYGNGNFRIPAAAEPLNTRGGASARLVDDILVISWGNASFIVPGETLRSQLAAGNELAIKVPHHDPSQISFFSVNDASWLPDIVHSRTREYLLLGNERSRIPEMLQQKSRKRFFISLSRGDGWELFWNDGIDFVVPAKR